MASCRAEDSPQITPPISWLRAVMGLMMVPAAKADTARAMRTSFVRLCTRISTKCAPKEKVTTSLRRVPPMFAICPW